MGSMASTSRALAAATLAVLAAAPGCGKMLHHSSKGAASASAAASGAPPAPVAGGGQDQVGSFASSIDPKLANRCERQCQTECIAEQLGDRAWYEEKRAALAHSPFKLALTRVYLSGSCAKGDDPVKRSDGDGIQVIVDGKLTYTGKDMLGSASLGGSAYLRFGDRYASVGMLEKAYSMWGGTHVVSRLLRPARGGDPWLPGESRLFHWESRAFGSVFCEAEPDSAEAYIDVTSYGVKAGRDVEPVGFVPVQWREVVGMVVNKSASLEMKHGNDTTLEPVEALYSRLERILVRRDGGKIEWVARDKVEQPAPFAAADAAPLPVEAKSPGFTVRVKKMTAVKDFGAYEPKGEDQFLVVMQLDLVSTQTADGDKEPKPAKARDFSFKLETAPGHWASPLKQPIGVLEGDAEIGVGETKHATLVFPRQRFERPTRFEVKTPDKQSFDLDVFSYAIGPERAPK